MDIREEIKDCLKCREKTAHQIWEERGFYYWVCQECYKIRKHNLILDNDDLIEIISRLSRNDRLEVLSEINKRFCKHCDQAEYQKYFGDDDYDGVENYK